MTFINIGLLIVAIWKSRKGFQARGGGGTPPKLGYNAQHKLKIWTLRDLKTSEKGGLKDLKRVFDKF